MKAIVKCAPVLVVILVVLGAREIQAQSCNPGRLSRPWTDDDGQECICETIEEIVPVHWCAPELAQYPPCWDWSSHPDFEYKCRMSDDGRYLTDAREACVACTPETCRTVCKPTKKKPRPACDPKKDPSCCDDEGNESLHVISGTSTYSAQPPGVSFATGSGRFSLEREYSSYRAQQEMNFLGNRIPLESGSWGGGWYHRFDAALYIDEDDPDDVVRFMSPQGVLYRGSLSGASGSRTVFLPEYDGGHTIEEDTNGDFVFLTVDGERWVFRSVVRYKEFIRQTNGSHHLLVPVEVRLPGDDTISIERYQVAPDGSPDALCEVSSADRKRGLPCTMLLGKQGFIHFASYSDNYTNPEGGAGYNTAPTEIRYGPRINIGVWTHVARFQYETVEHDVYGVTPDCGMVNTSEGLLPDFDYGFLCAGHRIGPRYRRMLSAAEYYVLDENSNEVLFDRETYRYTDQSLLRSDLGDAELDGNPYATRETIKILVDRIGEPNGAQNIYLLETVLRGDGYFEERYGYDRRGDAVSLVEEGHQLLVEYIDEGGSQFRTVVTNESSGEVKEYIIDRDVGRIVSSSAECGCGASATSFEHDADGVLMGLREPGADASTSGIRTAYLRDDERRKIWELRNYENAVPQDPMATIDPLAEMVDMRRYEYGRHPLSPTVVDRVSSAACSEVGYWGGVCLNGGQSPQTISDYDLDTLGEPNEEIHPVLESTAAMVPSRRIERGYSVVSILDGYEVDYLSRERATMYDGFGRLRHAVRADGLVSSYLYYGSNPGPDDNARKLQYRYFDSTLVDGVVTHGELEEEYLDYNAYGQAERVINYRTGLNYHRLYDERGRLSTSEVSGPEGSRLQEYTYNDNNTISTMVLRSTPSSEIVETRYGYDHEHGIDMDASNFCSMESVENIEDCKLALSLLRRPKSISRGASGGGTFEEHSQTVMAYDLSGNVVEQSTFDGAGVLQSKRGNILDLSGRQVGREKYTVDTENPSAEWRQLYDHTGRPTLVADENHIGLDASDTDVRANANQETLYDGLGRVASVTVDRGGEDAAMTSYYYDAHNNLNRVIDPDGRETRYLYDDFGQLIATDSPDSGLTYYRYDLNGNLEEKVVRGQLTEAAQDDWRVSRYSYDSRLRMTTEEISTGNLGVTHVTSYSYDVEVSSSFGASCVDGDRTFEQSNVADRLSYVLDASGATYYAYNSFGDVVSVYSSADHDLDLCAMMITRYEYDGLGRLRGVTYPSGRKVLYVYELGTLNPLRLDVEDSDTVETLISDLVYDAEGRVVEYSGAGMSFDASFDFAGQAIRREYVSTSNAIYDFNIRERDGVGNILEWEDTSSAKKMVVGYDGQYRLNQAEGSLMRGYQDCEYGYDATGNRSQETCYGTTRNFVYEPSSNRLEAVNWNTSNVCGEGEVILSRETHANAFGEVEQLWNKRYGSVPQTLAYDAAGRLISVSSVDDTTHYTYDYLGHRRSKTLPDTSELRFGYGQDGALLFEQDAGGTQEYIWLNGTLVGTHIGGSHYLVATDHLGTPQRLVGGDGDVVWAADYEVFGRASEYIPGSVEAPSVSINLRFPGQYYDEESGLHQNWWRGYDPTTGRYTRTDPKGLAGRDPTLYGYAGGSPLVSIDPKGLTSITVNVRAGKMYVDPEVPGLAPYMVSITTGKPPGCTNNPECEKKRGRGPIPAGAYYLQSNRLVDPSAFMDAYNDTVHGDWGDWRVPIVGTSPLNSPDENGKQRGSFYLHGGRKSGTAGCVDFGGGIFGSSQTDILKSDILNDPDGIVPFQVN